MLALLSQVVKEVRRENWLTSSGAINHTVHLLVTPKVKEEARQHFNCNTLEGAELENQGGKGTALAHLEKRLFENEGMTGIFTHNSVFSRLTLAVMEDTGWYKVNYQLAEPLQWGKNLGCLFAKSSCGAWMKAQSDAGKSIAPFCNQLRGSSGGRTSCSVDRTAVAKCNLVQYKERLPQEYQNFFKGSLPGLLGLEAKYGGNIALADYCPFYQGFTWTKNNKDIRSSSCVSHHNNLEQGKNYALETYGNSSTCFEQTVKWTKKKCGVHWTASNWGSGCYKHACEQDSLKIIISGYKFQCFHMGQHINVALQYQGWYYQGVLVCPSCQEVCSGSTIRCPPEVIPAPENSQPLPKVLTCSQGSVLWTKNSSHLMILLVAYKFAVILALFS